MSHIPSQPEKTPEQHGQFYKLLQSIGTAAVAAVVTVTFIHPIDVVKTRLQISGETGRVGGGQYNGVFSTVGMLMKEKGLSTFYKGIQAAYMRELSYTSLRLGLYTPIKDLISGKDKTPGPFGKFMAGALSGAIAATAGNPFDLLKTRMMAKQGDNLGMVEAMGQIYSKQGLMGFYKGLSANISRGIVLNATKLGTYDIVKGIYKEKIQLTGMGLHFMSAFTAGFFMTLTVTPFDMCRTRLMNQPHDQILYRGLGDAFVKIYKNEGFTALYKGFIPVWGRFAPTTVLQLVILEQLRKFFGMKQI